jgi:hypothetical protein
MRIELLFLLLLLLLLLLLSRVLVTLDAGLDWRINLLDVHQAELQLIITLSVLL